MERSHPGITKSKWFWKGCKPIFVFALASGENHLSQQPVPGTWSLSRHAERAAPGSPIWPCTRWGLPCLVAYASSGGLLHHLFTLTASNRRRRFNFLWHFPSASLPTLRLRVSQSNGLGLRSIAPCGVRTFLPRLAPGAILRPSKTAFNLRDAAKITSWLCPACDFGLGLVRLSWRGQHTG